MISMRIGRPESGVLVGYSLNTQMFTSIFFNQLDIAVKRQERVKFCAVSAQKFQLIKVSRDGTFVSDLVIELPAKSAEHVHGLFSRAISDGQYSRLFNWPREEERVATIALLDRYSMNQPVMDEHVN